jgi:cytochrome oxidase Cu insertion factor (SCO1/SenC/PrrC family)
VDKRNKSRLTFVAIVLVFAAPLLAALLLSRSGWRPQTTRNYGVLVEPPLDVTAVPVTLAGGTPLAWRDPQWHWTLLAFGNGACAEPCQSRLAELMRMRITLGRNAERLRIVYLGPAPPPAAADAATPLLAADGDAPVLAPYRPAAAGAVSLALVDPNGLLMLRYPPGYDAARLRQDVVKVVH